MSNNVIFYETVFPYKSYNSHNNSHDFLIQENTNGLFKLVNYSRGTSSHNADTKT